MDMADVEIGAGCCQQAAKGGVCITNTVLGVTFIVTNTNCVRREDDAEDFVVFDTLTCIPIYLWLLVINHALCTVAGGG